MSAPGSYGWVKLYRQLIDSQVFQNEGLLKVWLWCLLKAAHKGQWAEIQMGPSISEVWLKPGQFIFGRHSAAKKLKMKESTVWKRMLKLQKIENLNIESNTHYSLITIINWDSYQNHIGKSDIIGDRRGTAGGHKQECVKNAKEDTAGLYELYLTEIAPKEKTRQRALANIESHLKKYSAVELRQAILNYKTIVAKREPQYRKNPANFFGKQDPEFIDYLPENFQAERNKPSPSPPIFSINDSEALERLYSNDGQ